MDVLEMSPGVLGNALLVQQVVTEVQHLQVLAAPQFFPRQLHNLVLFHTEDL